VCVGAALTSCGNDREVNAPSWVLNLARAEAADMDEPKPTIDFAACGPATCIVRMLGSFTCHDCPIPPGVSEPQGARLDIEIGLASRVIETRRVFSGA
jgi:hypothetical protein